MTLPKMLALTMSVVLLAGVIWAEAQGSTDRASVALTVASGAARLDISGADGRIRYDWMQDPSIAAGAGMLRARRVDRPNAPIAVRYRLIWSQPAQLSSSNIVADGHTAVLTQRFQVGAAAATVVMRGHVVDGALVLDLSVDQPLLAKWQIGLVESPDLVRFAIPYNPVDVWRSRGAEAFAALSLDWTASNATRIEPDGAVYLPRSDGTRNSARERLILPVSPRIEAVLPRAAATRSRYYDQMAGRVVIDIVETETFAEIRRKLLALRDAGMADCVVIVHVWQRMGYDNGLPSVLPANAFLGGEEALKEIGDIVRSASCDFALHQNYVDYYPNALDFDIALAALDGAGKPAKSWFNEAVGIGSYLTKARAMLTLARDNAPEIKRRLGTTASFLDVNSGMAPWEKVDMDARERDGGAFSGFGREVRGLFAFMQDAERGPILGEGKDHFYWTGAVDGVEAEMRVGYRGDDVRKAPLWVDFDLLRMHPFQHNFGMGFYNRYAPAMNAARDPMVDENTRDIYRSQQLAFAHLPYRSGSLWGDVRLYVQEAALAGPVARAYGDTPVRDIRYRAGDRWVPIEVALPAGADRTVRVRYANGLVVTANTGDAVVTDDQGTALSRGGWSATGAGLSGRSATVGGQRQDFLQSSSSIYADPRTTPGNWVAAAGGDAAPTDFGPVRTNGQTWLRCAGGYWTILGLAQRGTIDLEVRQSTIARPRQLRADRTADVVPASASSAGYWRVRLVSGHRYATPVACAA